MFLSYSSSVCLILCDELWVYGGGQVPINVGGPSINSIFWEITPWFEAQYMIFLQAGVQGIFASLYHFQFMFVNESMLSIVVILFGVWWDVLWSLWGLFVQIVRSKDHDSLKRGHPEWSLISYAYSFRMNILIRSKHGARSSMDVWPCCNCMTFIKFQSMSIKLLMKGMSSINVYALLLFGLHENLRSVKIYQITTQHWFTQCQSDTSFDGIIHSMCWLLDPLSSILQMKVGWCSMTTPPLCTTTPNGISSSLGTITSTNLHIVIYV